MPFSSQQQRKWMYATHPAMAARWEAETPKDAPLPKKVTDAPKVRYKGTHEK